MYDIHSHLLFGIDDGPATIEDTLNLVEAAINEGITHAVLTPHHHNGMFKNEKERVLKKYEHLQSVLTSIDSPLKIRPSQEVQLQSFFLDEFYEDKYLSLDENGKYYLIEFPWNDYPSFTQEYLQELINQNITPIIAHPERQRAFSENMHRLEKLVEIGCIAQLTSTSLVEPRHQRALDASYKMIEAGLIHVIASDAHHIVNRPHNLKAAYQRVQELYGDKQEALFKENAQAIFEGRPIKYMG